MNKKIKIGILLVALVAVVSLVGVKINEPLYKFTLDVNPSIEIASNRLNRVVEVKALNEDGVKMLSEFTHKDKSLQGTIEDLADLMVLNGYISGGQDNLVMITVTDDEADEKLVNRLNEAIAAYLQNKQIEATIVNQAIPANYSMEGQTGREYVVERMKDLDDDFNLGEYSNMTLNELLAYAQENNISLERLFNRIIGKLPETPKVNHGKWDDREIISIEEAKEIALNLVKGEIVKVELDDFDDDDNPEYEIKIKANGKEYEIEIDAVTGRVLEFEEDDDDARAKDKPKTNNTKKPSISTSTSTSNKRTRISIEEAKKIALAKVGGGRVTEFEYDDGEYEIEIEFNGKEYEIEIDAYTGKIRDFEVDEDDDYKSGSSNTKKRISVEEAKKIALAKVGGGRITEFEYDDGEYEIEIEFNGKEYEIEIDAYTGKILDFEIDD